jgi:hypothetical protein
MIGNFWTPLKAQSDSTSVSYYRLGEFAKFVEYKTYADSIITFKKLEINSLELAYKKAETRLKRLNDTVIPTLNDLISEKTLENNHIREKVKLKDEIIKSKKGGFLKGIGLGAALVAVLALFVG